MSAQKTLIALVDGFDPDYLRPSGMPNLRRLIAGGVYKVGRCVIPSVTNVNNASVVTASFPAQHGIVSNFYFDRNSRQAVMMESADFLLGSTIFEQAAGIGLGSALVTAKDKIKTLLARGAGIAVSAEKPDAALVAAVGEKPNLYSAEANYWVFRAARHLLRQSSVNVLYLSTTDYMMHTYDPDHERSLEHMHELDHLLGFIVDDHPDLRLALTADHGMNAKTEGIDVARVLAACGIEADAVPIIRDIHVIHHQNLGGACYVYLKRPADLQKAEEALAATEGIEEAYRRADAARRFRLREDRIGDLFLLAARGVVFGELPAARQEVSVRSHGSRHEEAVPLLCYGWKADAAGLRYNLDLTRLLLAHHGC